MKEPALTAARVAAYAASGRLIQVFSGGREKLTKPALDKLVSEHKCVVLTFYSKNEGIREETPWSNARWVVYNEGPGIMVSHDPGRDGTCSEAYQTAYGPMCILPVADAQQRVKAFGSGQTH